MDTIDYIDIDFFSLILLLDGMAVLGLENWNGN